MYSQERELKKLRYMVRNKESVDGCIAEAFTCKEITNFSSLYFSRANNVNVPTTWYLVVHYVTDKEWNYSILYMHMSMEEVEPYF
jgi:hypothetical protein